MLFQVVPPSVEYCQALVPTTSPFSSVIDVAVMAIPCTAFRSTSLCAVPNSEATVFPGLFRSSSVIVVKGCVFVLSSTGASLTSVTVIALEPVAVL